MFKTQFIEKAIAHAKGRIATLKDLTLISHKREFTCSEGGMDLDVVSPALVLNQIAISHVSKMFNIPGAWIKTKQMMGDPEHLKESFNRHVQSLENRKLIFRTMSRPGDDSKTLCYAVWPEKTVNIDILPMLRLVQQHLGGYVDKWAFIHIDGFTLRMFGRLKCKGRDGAFIPGIYITTSEDGSFGIKCGLGMGVPLKPYFLLLDFPQMQCASFKRMESEEGQLRDRFIKTAKSLIEKRQAGCKLFDEHFDKLTEVAPEPSKEGPVKLLEMGRKTLSYSKKLDNVILGCWVQTNPVLTGYMAALMRTAHEQALSSSHLDAHNLNRAAGVLLAHGNDQINQSLAELTKEPV